MQDENEINNKNEQFEFLLKEINLLKDENKTLKNEIEKNKKNILILIDLLKSLKKEHQNKINELEEIYKAKVEKTINIMVENKIGEYKNEIIIDKKAEDKNNKKNDNKIKEKNNNEIKPKKEKTFLHLFKGEKTEKKPEIVESQTLLDIFENKVSDIFFDDSEHIDKTKLNDFRKISTCLLIKNKSPDTFLGQFFEKNYNNNLNELSEDKKPIIGNKKSEIYLILGEIETFSLKYTKNDLTKIDKKKLDEFIKELREKCGITEEDFKEKDLKKEIKNSKYEFTIVIKNIFKKLNYLKKDD